MKCRFSCDIIYIRKVIEVKHSKRVLDIVKNYTLLNDDFMKIVFADKECTQLMLQIILEKRDLEVITVKSEYTVNNLHGRGVRFDVYAKDSKGIQYDIEVQRSDKGANRKRARYNSSMLDANITEPGDDYEQLKETYVIFITENDVIGNGLPIYHVDRVIKETGELFNDKAHIIYVNSEITDETELGRLMYDFRCKNADEMKNKLLSEKVKMLKETDEGVDSMCKAVEDYGKELREKGILEGIEKGKAEGMAKGMAKGRAEGMAKGRAEGMAKGKMDTLEVLRKLGVDEKILQEALKAK